MGQGGAATATPPHKSLSKMGQVRLRACVRACVRVCVRACVRPCVRASVRPCVTVPVQADTCDSCAPAWLCARQLHLSLLVSGHVPPSQASEPSPRSTDCASLQGGRHAARIASIITTSAHPDWALKRLELAPASMPHGDGCSTPASGRALPRATSQKSSFFPDNDELVAHLMQHASYSIHRTSYSGAARHRKACSAQHSPRSTPWTDSRPRAGLHVPCMARTPHRDSSQAAACCAVLPNPSSRCVCAHAGLW